MKKIFNFILVAVFTFTACNSTKSPIKVKNGVLQPIETEVPVRPAWQKHVVGLTAPNIDVVRVGFIGLGMRGPSAVYRFTHIPGVEIKALCDLHPDRV